MMCTRHILTCGVRRTFIPVVQISFASHVLIVLLGSCLPDVSCIRRHASRSFPLTSHHTYCTYVALRMISKNGPLDYEIDSEALMQVLVARRRGKPKYKISISRNIFSEIVKNEFTVDALNAFINHPNNQDGVEVIHRRNNIGRTPLMFAASAGNFEVVKALLGMGCKLTAKDKHERTCLVSFHTSYIV